MIKTLKVCGLLLFSVLLAAPLASCDDEEEDAVVIRADKVQFDNQGGTANINVTANASWTITNIPTWLTVDPTYGNGDLSLTATAEPNTSYTTRNVTLTVRCGTANDTITFYQAASIRQPNVNANDTTGYGAVASRMEMPRFNTSNTFVTHYAMLNNKSVVNFSLEWNAELKHSAWVAYTMDKYNSQQNVKRASSDAFQADPDLPKDMQVTNYNHTNDGLDRGHICASGDRLCSTEMNEQTFYFSNMSPMLNGFNTGIWRRMEDEVRTWGDATQANTYDTVYVCKGGTINNRLINFTGQTAGADGKTPTTDANGMTVKGLACPAYYFMAILAVKDGEYKAIAFLVPHDDQIKPLDGSSEYSEADLRQYTVTIDKLEEETGLDFFCNLPDLTEAAAESQMGEFWK